MGNGETVVFVRTDNVSARLIEPRRPISGAFQEVSAADLEVGTHQGEEIVERDGLERAAGVGADDEVGARQRGDHALIDFDWFTHNSFIYKLLIYLY